MSDENAYVRYPMTADGRRLWQLSHEGAKRGLPDVVHSGLYEMQDLKLAEPRPWWWRRASAFLLAMLLPSSDVVYVEPHRQGHAPDGADPDGAIRLYRPGAPLDDLYDAPPPGVVAALRPMLEALLETAKATSAADQAIADADAATAPPLSPAEEARRSTPQGIVREWLRETAQDDEEPEEDEGADDDKERDA